MKFNWNIVNSFCIFYMRNVDNSHSICVQPFFSDPVLYMCQSVSVPSAHNKLISHNPARDHFLFGVWHLVLIWHKKQVSWIIRQIKTSEPGLVLIAEWSHYNPDNQPLCSVGRCWQMRGRGRVVPGSDDCDVSGERSGRVECEHRVSPRHADTGNTAAITRRNRREKLTTRRKLFWSKYRERHCKWKDDHEHRDPQGGGRHHRVRGRGHWRREQWKLQVYNVRILMGSWTWFICILVTARPTWSRPVRRRRSAWGASGSTTSSATPRPRPGSRRQRSRGKEDRAREGLRSTLSSQWQRTSSPWSKSQVRNKEGIRLNQILWHMKVFQTRSICVSLFIWR